MEFVSPKPLFEVGARVKVIGYEDYYLDPEQLGKIGTVADNSQMPFVQIDGFEEMSVFFEEELRSLNLFEKIVDFIVVKTKQLIAFFNVRNTI